MTQNIIIKYKTSPSFSFRSKLNNHTTSNNPQQLPSPNLYSPSKPFKNQPKVIFSKSSRKTFFDKVIEKSPGPGQYQTHQNKDQNHSASKFQNKNKTFTSRFYQKFQLKPGPGAYQIKNDFKKTLPSFSLRKKTIPFCQIQIQQNSFKQGPGAYEIQPKLIRSTSVTSIPKSPRMVHKLQKSPGPGNYDINQTFYSQRSFGKKNFSNSMRKISFFMKNESPGPGKYADESSFEINKRKQKGYSCRKKLIQLIKKGQNVPGPGKYDTDSDVSYRSIESCKIPKAQRNTFQYIGNHQEQNPGPAKYQNLSQSYSKLNFKSQSAPKFSKAKLQILSEIKLDTTDKFYDLKVNMMKKSSSSFSIGGQKRKSMFQMINKLPGPGDYQNDSKMTKQAILAPKFGQSLRSNSILNKFKVGPGSYLDNEIISTLRKTGTKFSKGERKTDILVNSQNRKSSIIRISNTMGQQYKSLVPTRR